MYITKRRKKNNQERREKKMERVSYSDNELKIVGNYMGTSASAPRYNTPVTPRENINQWIRGEKPLWFPTTDDFVFITPRIIADNIARGFAFECLPPLTAEESGGPDMFGTEWVYVPQVGGSMVKPGNPRLSDVNDWRRVITMPDPDTFDWKGSAKINAGLRDSGRSFQGMLLTGMFERLIYFEGAALALIDEEQQDAVHDLFGELADFNIKLIDRHIEYYGIEGITFHDDWGSQRAPFFSLATAREMLVPYIRKIADHCHEKGLWFQIHSCGKNELLVPAYIEAHVDIWCGQSMNDKEALYKQYGDQIFLGMDLPVFPEGTPAEKIDDFAADFAQKYRKGNILVNVRGVRREVIEAVYRHSRIVLGS